MKIMEIEKNIPMISKRGGGMYPLERMKIGDSFLVVKEDDEDLRELLRRVNPSVFKRAKKLGFGVACRSVWNGVRVWRVE